MATKEINEFLDKMAEEMQNFFSDCQYELDDVEPGRVPSKRPSINDCRGFLESFLEEFEKNWWELIPKFSKPKKKTLELSFKKEKTTAERVRDGDDF